MTSRDFCYWLQGVFELADPKEINERTTALIKAHLSMVFIHEIDPSFPKDQQVKLDNAHWPDGKSPKFPNSSWPAELAFPDPAGGNVAFEDKRKELPKPVDNDQRYRCYANGKHMSCDLNDPCSTQGRPSRIFI